MRDEGSKRLARFGCSTRVDSDESEIGRAEGREVGQHRRECRRGGAKLGGQVARIVRPGQREYRHRAVDLSPLDGTSDDEKMTPPRVIPVLAVT